jgi:hypothetical protein
VLVVPHASRYRNSSAISWSRGNRGVRPPAPLSMRYRRARMQILLVRQRADDPPAPGQNSIGPAL